MVSLEPRLFNLENMFRGRLFTIPDYQRSYSWLSKQRYELLSDIQDSFEKKRSSHFMATIVVLNKGLTKEVRTNKYHYVEVVDGQQRLTTLAILYKALSKALDESDADEKITKNELENLLVIKDRSSPILLQTNHDVSGIFGNYIRTGAVDKATLQTSADENIIEAINDCENFVSNWKAEKGSIIDLISHIKYKLTFVYYEIDDESIVYSVFELLNSRGLPVEPLDRLKSVLMGIAFDLPCESVIHDDIQRRWSDIYRVIGTQEISKYILRCAAYLHGFSPGSVPFYRSLLDSDFYVDYFSQVAKGSCSKIIETADWIEKITRSINKQISNPSKFITIFSPDKSLPEIAIDIREDFSEETKNELLRSWRKTQFCMYGICRLNRRRKPFTISGYAFHRRVHLEEFASDIVNKRMSPSEIKNIFVEIIKSLPVNKALEDWAKSDVYNLYSDEIRYVLYRYEKHLANEKKHKIYNDQWNRIWQASDFETIEHITPQSSKKPYVHWLGNLFLLPPGLNSQLNDKRPIDKANAYRCTGFLMAQEIIPYLSEWNEQVVVERGQKIVQWAKHEWGNI